MKHCHVSHTDRLASCDTTCWPNIAQLLSIKMCSHQSNLLNLAHANANWKNQDMACIWQAHYVIYAAVSHQRAKSCQVLLQKIQCLLCTGTIPIISIRLVQPANAELAKFASKPAVCFTPACKTLLPLLKQVVANWLAAYSNNMICLPIAGAKLIAWMLKTTTVFCMPLRI